MLFNQKKRKKNTNIQLGKDKPSLKDRCAHLISIWLELKLLNFSVFTSRSKIETYGISFNIHQNWRLAFLILDSHQKWIDLAFLILDSHQKWRDWHFFIFDCHQKLRYLAFLVFDFHQNWRDLAFLILDSHQKWRDWHFWFLILTKIWLIWHFHQNWRDCYFWCAILWGVILVANLRGLKLEFPILCPPSIVRLEKSFKMSTSENNISAKWQIFVKWDNVVEFFHPRWMIRPFSKIEHQRCYKPANYTSGRLRRAPMRKEHTTCSNEIIV